jgi:sortase (surface protein transpeptidase)
MNNYLGTAILIMYASAMVLLMIVQMLRGERIAKLRKQIDMYKARCEVQSNEILKMGRDKKEIYDALVEQKRKMKEILKSLEVPQSKASEKFESAIEGGEKNADV